MVAFEGVTKINQASLAKISRPRLFGVIARGRLFRELEANRGRSVLWMSAPPGAGKASLAASHIEAGGRPCVWYQVDGEDADPAAFFHYLSEAANSLWSRAAAPLPRFLPEHLDDLAGFARRFFRAFFAGLPPGLVLVFDNYQELPTHATLHECVDHCFGELPPEDQVFVLSRADPPEHFVVRRANGQVHIVGWDRFRLSLEEVREICGTRGIADDWLIQALHHQSDGWAAGITLMLERLGHFDGGTGELPHDTRDAVFGYFARLVFDQSSPAVREVLLSLALVPYATPALAVELSGRTGAHDHALDLHVS